MAKRNAEQKLADIVIGFEGTVEEALRTGLIRLNFPAPPGFYKQTQEDE